MPNGGYPWPSGEDVRKTGVGLITITQIARDHGLQVSIRAEWPYWIELSDPGINSTLYCFPYCTLEECHEKDPSDTEQLMLELKRTYHIE